MLDQGTIAAVATAPGTAAIGVIRISGPEAADIAGRVFRAGERDRAVDLRRTRSHQLIYGYVIDPVTGDRLDEIMLAWMAAPRTFTREDTVELSCHGGPATLAEVLRVVLGAGARPAEPGEFTLRAFLNGRLDLTRAEAVLAVVDARTGDAMRLAVDDLSGSLAERLRPAQVALVELTAHLDALADFPDDEVPPADVADGLERAALALDGVLSGARSGQLYREGARVALVGRPNVGKSSLLNALLRNDRAIVTPIAGTTRDVVSETASLGGVPITLLDTAGIADSDDPVEQLGIARSRQALRAAAAAVLVVDGSVEPQRDDLAVADALVGRLSHEEGDRLPVVVATNKADLGAGPSQAALTDRLPGCAVVPVSATTGAGLPDLEAAIVAALGADTNDAQPSLLTARQRAALDRAAAHVAEADAARQAGYPLDLLAVDVRAALHAVGSVTGDAVDEHVLAEIFSRFCIGK
ncbi:MAG TPA: tRNA uridine-5-carboxymethylaminomethyl(34) synthesis GTPase MnmE [Thermomicrobiales bacterium]|jgi:tRNA modification GTPase|nr:tRNA uridine-5-carboxymethylaminomethyl(34) synthesis GTPase MnmE [Thermomicrobiales bacterium]